MIQFDSNPARGQTLTPYMTVKNAEAMLEFYQKAFGAEVIEVSKVPGTDLVMFAQVKIGSGFVFVNDEFPDHGALSPASTGHTSSNVHVQVAEGIDELFAQAISAGATVVMELADQFWGDRYGMVQDPSGHKWGLGQTIK